MISMDKKYKVMPGEYEATIHTVNGLDPNYPVIGEWKQANGCIIGDKFSPDGRSKFFKLSLVEISPYDHIKEGDWCVFSNTAEPDPFHPNLRRFAGIDSDGRALSRQPSPRSISWPYCLPIAEFLEKYGK